MNRTFKAILAVVFIIVIMVSAVSIISNIGRNLKVDVTEQKLYTLSNGTKAILGKLSQPVKLKLFYTKTAAMKGPDNIRFYNNYFYFVRSLMEEYANQSNGLLEFEVIDPRPYSEEEAQAIKYGLKRVPMSEDESFIFGLVLQTPLGVNKTIEMFDPGRKDFVEYDISYLIDTAITREKSKIGVLSSLPVMGDDVTGYMAQMMAMQGKRPNPAWTIIEQLRMKYEVESIPTDVNEITDVDILMVVHPKELSEQTLFAIDQFVLSGGKTIVCVDPHAIADQPEQQQMMMQPDQHSSSSNLNVLLEKWGLYMPEDKFAGDRELAVTTSLRQGMMPEKIIAFLNLNKRSCFNQDNIISAQLNDVRVLFSGILMESATDANGSAIKRIPLVSTTERGNSWAVSSPYELMMLNPKVLMSKFYEGTSAVHIGYQVTGKFESAFPEGITLTDANDPNSQKHLSGLAKADQNCNVVVFADVDFMTDMLAYQQNFFGSIPVADNAAMLINAADNLAGSSELISIRSKGNIKRNFEVVDDIESEVAKATLEEEERINTEIQTFQAELNKIVSNDGADAILGNEVLAKKAELEKKLYDAQLRLREVKNKKREKIESLKAELRNYNTLPGPALILLIAIGLGVRRSMRKRQYISHASDA